MAKPKFNLTSEIIKSASENTEVIYNNSDNYSKINSNEEVNSLKNHQIIEMVTTTLRVPKTFLKDFKVWCTINNTSMSKALEVMFNEYKHKMNIK